MKEDNNIVNTLIGQHRTLQKDLGLVADLLVSEKPDALEIDKLLKQFANDLTEHLHLENDVFYVSLLEKMKNKRQDTRDTEEFIAQMTKIGEAVHAFLDKYKDAVVIQDTINEFKPEFSIIVKTLNLRIESEELGIYTVWESF